MRYLLVYAHPSPRSFNRAILDRVMHLLSGKGFECEVSDLYGMGFDPVLPARELVRGAGEASPEVAAEQEKIRRADVLVFIYPLWWFGMPSILRGWVDRVFTEGFAYEVGPKGLRGLLDGKRVAILNTTGADETLFRRLGYHEAVATTIDHGIFEFCRMKVALHHYFFAVQSVDDSTRRAMLDGIDALGLEAI